MDHRPPNELEALKERCARDAHKLSCYREQIPALAEEIIHSCNEEGCYTHVEFEPIPSRDSVVAIIAKWREILFPGYFSSEKLDPSNLRYSLGQAVSSVFDMLAEQVILSVRHDCFRYNRPCALGTEKGYEVALDVLNSVPAIRRTLASDVRATYNGDPAAKSYDEIIFSYPGIYAVMVYRLAHRLYELGVPLLPRIMTEHAHGITGIDIHPGAEIGPSFVIDHGTGVVIGETTVIGRNVRIYQGVTLGALSLPRGAGDLLRRKKRHPTIEDNVIIYSGATILGGRTVIGTNAVIGGNVWLTDSVPPDTTVIMETPRLIYKHEQPGLAAGATTDPES
jgi:serine O-acetyltransferase